jgi:ubiquinone/menaquinone biosynthesis C-methylase UbiE
MIEAKTLQEDSKTRFSSRAEYYSKYRPRYPEDIIQFMRKELGFGESSVIADIGSGTGILSELFLKHGNTVFAVEPNREMRATAEALLSKYPGFRSVQGTAEDSTLPATSVDFVTAAQAFHWFDPIKTKVEFSSILKPNGWVLLVWNVRTVSTALMREYESLVSKYATRSCERGTAKARVGEEGLRNFLGQYGEKRFENSQVLNFEGLKGRLLSSSYAPLPAEQGNDSMLAELRRIFDSYQQDGVVHFDYETEVYYAQLSS